MVRLDRSMMERYEIADRRPKALRAALFGLDTMMLCAAARLLDRANELGGDLGAVCITGSEEAKELRAQDGMFTLMVRGENEDGSPFREERVVQSILEVADVDEGKRYAVCPEIDLYMMSVPVSPEDFVEEVAVLTHYLRLRCGAKLSAPHVLLFEKMPSEKSLSELRACVFKFASLVEEPGFSEWLEGGSFHSILVDSLFGELCEAEFAKVQREMNYQDRFLLWAEPQLFCVSDSALPKELAAACADGDFALACERKLRVFDALVFLCAAVGFLSGMDNFSQVLRDEKLRAFIGHAFFDELMPVLPWSREEVSPYVISSFARLENSMNDVPLLQECLMDGFHRALLPSIRAYAEREFEAPPRLTLALSAAIIIYAGARKNDDGIYEILRGKDRFIVCDAPRILEAFSLLAHDMPAETLTYAVLADRHLWGEDLREIDGLELRVALDLASIQRVGFRETHRLRET